MPHQDTSAQPEPQSTPWVSETIQGLIDRASWIRQMFEEGEHLKRVYGPEAVFDFTLGNPSAPPPPQLHASLRSLLADPPADLHRYPPNIGLPEARTHVAAELTAASGQTFSSERVIMTCGAGGALNVLFKAILNPGDEVIVFAPYFVEYAFYATNHGGVLVTADTDARFQLDLASLERCLTPRTRAVVINAPNNPTGVIYNEACLQQLATCLDRAGRRLGHPIMLISDEPYRDLVFDGMTTPWPSHYYPQTVVVNSYSKSLGLAGERLGYIALPPTLLAPERLMEALVFSHRILGFVNAPTLMQRVLPRLGKARVESAFYQKLRDALLPALRQIGYDVVTPQGAFYLFPRSPLADDVAFVQLAQAENLLLVPGSGFGKPGYFRVALCVSSETIARAIPVFERVYRQAQEKIAS